MTHYHGYDSSHETWSWNCAETKPCRARIFPPLRAPAHRVSRQIPPTCTFIRCLFMTYWHWYLRMESRSQKCTVARSHFSCFLPSLYRLLSLSLYLFYISISYVLVCTLMSCIALPKKIQILSSKKSLPMKPNKRHQLISFISATKVKGYVVIPFTLINGTKL